MTKICVQFYSLWQYLGELGGVWKAISSSASIILIPIMYAFYSMSFNNLYTQKLMNLNSNKNENIKKPNFV